MRQHDLRHVFVLFRMMLAQPENLRRRVAGHHRIAGKLDAARGTAARLHDVVRFLLRRRIAPELYRVQDVAISVDGYETVLLTGNRNCARRPSNILVDLLQRLFQRFQPPARFLLGSTGCVAHDIERCGRRGSNLALIVVIEDDFQTLRAEIYAKCCVHLAFVYPPLPVAHAVVSVSPERLPRRVHRNGKSLQVQKTRDVLPPPFLVGIR